MRVDLTDDDGVLVASVTGDIDFGTADDLGRDVAGTLSDSAAGLVLDLTGVRYVDSSGVRVIFELAAQLGISGRKLALALPETSPIRRLVKITRLEEAALLCTTPAECTEMLRRT
jgi:anti-anti-sigma factor